MRKHIEGGRERGRKRGKVKFKLNSKEIKLKKCNKQLFIRSEVGRRGQPAHTHTQARPSPRTKINKMVEARPVTRSIEQKIGPVALCQNEAYFNEIASNCGESDRFRALVMDTSRVCNCALSLSQCH